MTLNKNKSKNIFIAMIMAAASQTAFSGSLPTKANLEYELSAASQPLGVVVRQLNKDGDVFTGNSIAKPNMFAKLFMKGDITESCEFTMINDQYVPVSYSSTRTGYKPYDREAIFDVNKVQVNYKDGSNESFDGVLWDQGCFVYGLSTMNIEDIQSKTIYLNDGDKSRVFKLTEAENEMVSVPAGQYETLRVRLERQDKPDQHTMVWLDTKTGLPVKSTNAREGKPSVTMELSAIK